jgi:hypothetical protein
MQSAIMAAVKGKGGALSAPESGASQRRFRRSNFNEEFAHDDHVAD